jgi:hypothetical protein
MRAITAGGECVAAEPPPGDRPDVVAGQQTLDEGHQVAVAVAEAEREKDGLHGRVQTDLRRFDVARILETCL